MVRRKAQGGKDRIAKCATDEVLASSKGALEVSSGTPSSSPVLVPFPGPHEIPDRTIRLPRTSLHSFQIRSMHWVRPASAASHALRVRGSLHAGHCTRETDDLIQVL